MSTRILSFSGKGGSGKTTTSTLFLYAAIQSQLFDDILIIDADPDTNLTNTLQCTVRYTVGDILQNKKLAARDCLHHADRYDYIVMGRPLGSGCYCDISSNLHRIMSRIMDKYDLVIVDYDAGLEHFSRRIGDFCDTLLVTCDPSKLSFETAQRIGILLSELEASFQNQYILGCRYNDKQAPVFQKLAAQTNFIPLGLIPFDEEIAAMNWTGGSLLELPPGNPSVQTAREMIHTVLQGGGL